MAIALSRADRIALCSSRLRGTHRCDSIFVDLNDVASRISAAHEALEAFRSLENDRVGVAAGLDHVALLDLLVEKHVEAVPASPERVDLSHGPSIASEAAPRQDWLGISVTQRKWGGGGGRWPSEWRSGLRHPEAPRISPDGCAGEQRREVIRRAYRDRPDLVEVVVGLSVCMAHTGGVRCKGSEQVVRPRAIARLVVERGIGHARRQARGVDADVRAAVRHRCQLHEATHARTAFWLKRSLYMMVAGRERRARCRAHQDKNEQSSSHGTTPKVAAPPELRGPRLSGFRTPAESGGARGSPVPNLR